MIALKSPRTPHLVGSGIPTSGESKDRIDWKSLIGRFVVLEEKIDGSEVSFHFDGDANLIGRERANPIDLDRRGGTEGHLDLFKDFLQGQADRIFERIEDRYLVYAEWCAITHTIFYNALPSYFIECDVQDKQTGLFLSTARRRTLFAGLPIEQAPVVFEGVVKGTRRPADYLGPSVFADSAASEDWRQAASRAGVAPDTRSVDFSGRAEGIYGKIEDDDHVLGRFKFVREDFIRLIVDDPAHWKSRQPVRNGLLTGP
jgi:hypothetical protein